MRNLSHRTLAGESQNHLNSSLISTGSASDQIEFEPRSSDHRETQVLLQTLSKMHAPVTVYLNNLPYELEDTTEIVKFLGFSTPDNVSVYLLMKEGRPSGRAIIITPTIEKAMQAVRQHGKVLQGRSIYMNLDGYFGRGKFYLRQINPRKSKASIVRHENRKVKTENDRSLRLNGKRIKLN